MITITVDTTSVDGRRLIFRSNENHERMILIIIRAEDF